MRAISKFAALGAVVITSVWLILNLIYAVKYIWGVDPTGLARMAPYISRVDISAANTIIFFLTADEHDCGVSTRLNYIRPDHLNC